MCLSKLNRCGIQRRPSARQPLTTLLVLGCWLISAGVCFADIIVKANVTQSNTTTTVSFDLNSPLIGVCPEGLGALVVMNGETLTIGPAGFVQDEEPVEFEVGAAISPAAMSVLANRLQADGLYNPAIHDLAFVSFIPNTCVGLSHIEVEYGVRDGANQVVLPPSLVFGQAFLVDLLAGGALPSFESASVPILAVPAVPAVSVWGLLALTLFLLVIGKIHFARRQAQTVR